MRVQVPTDEQVLERINLKLTYTDEAFLLDDHLFKAQDLVTGLSVFDPEEERAVQKLKNLVLDECKDSLDTRLKFATASGSP